MQLAIQGAIVLTLLAIVGSLGSGLFYLMRDRSESRRTLNALTVRIVLSVVLFLLILLGLATGMIAPNSSPLA
ncbi:twin transmembrane helix small protein [Sediminicurvatus halobius]|uniref:Twin transmembrane helix small protein n=1 Tax=Sediminicurvatus halobius TaxID=2182432 RepID=A0A2U2MY70_9GAMM|nr:twin transmembrane helix small protein [Spiribacter halobius]PWG61951.1 twin transmembrane helix small protein [Spiribacter halobius]UEX78358.1 twin transmembrane helix small protein [Spiribacter halobius]